MGHTIVGRRNVTVKQEMLTWLLIKDLTVV